MRIRSVVAWFVWFGFGFGISVAQAETPATVVGNFFAAPDGPVIAIAECGTGKLCGRIVGLGNLPAVDTRNPDVALKSRTLCGLEVLTVNITDDSTIDRRFWQGRLYHAERGTRYNVTMQLLDNGNLNLRGNTHVMGMTRSFQFMQTWQRATASYVACTAPAS